jgi:hypothetical protein
MLPRIKYVDNAAHPKSMKRHSSIVAQDIRSYRSFSRRHAYNTTIEVENKFSAKNDTYDNRKGSISTKSNTSPKAKQKRTKSQMSSTQSNPPEKIINVKAIDGRQMLESIQETKESEQQ